MTTTTGRLLFIAPPVLGKNDDCPCTRGANRWTAFLTVRRYYIQIGSAETGIDWVTGRHTLSIVLNCWSRGGHVQQRRLLLTDSSPFWFLLSPQGDSIPRRNKIVTKEISNSTQFVRNSNAKVELITCVLKPTDRSS